MLIKDGNQYHVEDNGTLTIVKKPVAERFPRSFIQPLRFEVPDTSQTLIESEFNKTIKEKKAQGLIKDVSQHTLE